MERIDRPSMWVRWREDLCRGCHGGCCMMPVEVRREDLVALGLATEDEPERKIARRLIREGVVKSWRAATGLYQLEQQADRSCVFMDSVTRLCSVYERRPEVCRKFPREMGPRIGYCPSFRKRESFSTKRSTSQAARAASVVGRSW